VADTLGSLVDKLITTNLKLWHVQDRVHEAASEKRGLDAETVQKLDALNLQRNKLMAEIDLLLSKAVETGTAEVNPQIKVY
jgi:hypothetical protein